MMDFVSMQNNENEKKAFPFCCSYSMTWPLYQKTQDPQLTRTISKKALSSSFSPGLLDHLHFLYNTGLDPIPCPIFASQSTLYSHLFTMNPTGKAF